jgi:conjugal transfer pilus assembly protein TraD
MQTMAVIVVMSLVGFAVVLLASLFIKKLYNATLSTDSTMEVGQGFSIWEKGYQQRESEEPTENVISLKLKDKSRNQHMIGTGTTRCGKSVLIAQFICSEIRKGFNVCLCDPKGDQELLTMVVKAAYECGRKKDIIIVNPIFPQFSAKISPLSYSFRPEDRVNHIVASLESKGGKATEQFFLEIAYEIVLVIAMSLTVLQELNGHHEVININTIRQYVTYNMLLNLKQQLEGSENIDKVKVGEVLGILSHVLSSPPEYFAKVSTTLRTTLTALSTGSVGQIMGKAEGNEFIRRLENDEGVILIVQTGSMLTRKVAHMIARLVVSMIQSFVGRRLAVGKKCTPPLSIFLDEAASVMYPGIEDLFSKSGQANCRVHCFMQSLADLDTNVGESQARTILDCTNTKIFMSLNDPKTCEYVSLSAGTITRLDHLYGGGLGGSITSREMEKYRIKPEDVSMLKPRQFFLFNKEGMYYGKTNYEKPLRPEQVIIFPNPEVTV